MSNHLCSASGQLISSQLNSRSSSICFVHGLARGAEWDVWILSWGVGVGMITHWLDIRVNQLFI